MKTVFQGVRWYLREVSGEGDYDRYVAHARVHHQDAPTPSRREFERRKAKMREANPTVRCC